MTDLSQLLLAHERTALTADLAELADENVKAQSGITGIAIKGAVGAAKKVDSNIITKGVNRMLPDILGDLQPHWQDFSKATEADFGAFLIGRKEQVIDSLMSVADRNAEQITIPALAKAYNGLRGKGAKIIEPAIPEFGRIVQKHMN